MGNKEQKEGKITKPEIVECVSLKLPYSTEVIQQVYDAIFDTIKNYVIVGKRVSVKNFGNFGTKTHKGHTAYYSDGGKTESYKVVDFNCSSNFTAEVREYDRLSKECHEND